MAVEIRVAGAEQLRALGRDLRAAGDPGKGLRRELLAAMRAVEKPLADKARKSAEDVLPKRGGLNAAWSKAVKVENRLTGTLGRVGVRIVARSGRHNLLDVDDSGEIRHPVFGNRSIWATQRVEAGWFSKPMNDSLPEVQAALVVAMNAVAVKIEKGF